LKVSNDAGTTENKKGGGELRHHLPRPEREDVRASSNGGEGANLPEQRAQKRKFSPAANAQKKRRRQQKKHNSKQNENAPVKRAKIEMTGK